MKPIAALLTGTFLLSLPLTAQAQSQNTAAANAPAPAVAQMTTCSDMEKAKAQANAGKPSDTKMKNDLCHAQNNGSPTPPPVESSRR